MTSPIKRVGSFRPPSSSSIRQTRVVTRSMTGPKSLPAVRQAAAKAMKALTSTKVNVKGGFTAYKYKPKGPGLSGIKSIKGKIGTRSLGPSKALGISMSIKGNGGKNKGNKQKHQGHMKKKHTNNPDTSQNDKTN